MNRFKAYVRRSNSIVAAHAIIRALARRQTLGKKSDLEAYLVTVCEENAESKSIALDGLDIIAATHENDLSKLTDAQASEYINWLSDFVIERSAHGRAANPDLGKTLLLELRKSFSG